MRNSSGLAVGSPTFRVAAIMVATLLVALTVAGAGIAGSRLLAAGPIVVDQSGAGTVRTITEAVAMAEDGDTILVKPGTYLESLAITKDITLQGDGQAESIVIEFTQNSPTVESDITDGPNDETVFLPYAIRLDDSDAMLAGFTVRGPAVGYGIRISGGAPAIDDITIELAAPDPSENSDANAPLWFGGGSMATVTNSSFDGYVGIRGSSPIIEGNTIAGYISIDGPGSAIVRSNQFVGDDTGVGMSYGGTTLVEANEFENGGISADTGADPTVLDNVIHRSELADCFDCAAIWIGQHDWSLEDGDASALNLEPGDLEEVRAVVEGNQVDNATTGIRVTGVGAIPTVRDNTIRNSSTGIAIEKGALPVVQANRVSDARVAFMLDNTDATLDGNTIERGDTGIVAMSGSPTLMNNTLENVRGRALAFGPGSAATLSGNTSCGNGTNLWQADGAELTVADDNDICGDAPAE